MTAPPRECLRFSDEPPKGFCCARRGRFVLAIVGERRENPIPRDLPDFVLDWNEEHGNPDRPARAYVKPKRRGASGKVVYSVAIPSVPEGGPRRPVLMIRYCPFCGAPLPGSAPRQGARGG